MKDLMGQAIWDYYHQKNTENLLTETSISEIDELPVEYFFRDFKSSLFVDFKIIPKTIGITAVNRPNIFNVYLSKFSNSSFLVFFFSKVKTNEGNTTKFANIAKAKVQEINPPSAIVPLKLDNVKVAKPRIKTTDV